MKQMIQIQIQILIQLNIQQQRCHLRILKLGLNEFPPNIPQSEIVEDNKLILVIDMAGEDTFLDNAKIKAHKLWKKYIMPGSEFEKNIEASKRSTLSNALGSMDDLLLSDMGLKDLLLIFENCKQEMKMLQSYSLSRFAHNPEFGDDI